MSRSLIKSFVFGLSVLFLCSSAYADEVGRFVSIEGRVDILKSGEDKTTPVLEGDAISSGDIIRTKSLSKAEIKFSDESILKLAENTRVEIKEYIVDESGLRKNAIINVQRGQVRAIVSKKEGETNFFVNTPNASGGIKGSDVFVFYQKSATGVLVEKGEFSIVNNLFPDESVDVPSGYVAIVPPEGPPLKPRQYLDIEKKRREAQTTILAKQTVAEEGTKINGTVINVSGDVRVRHRGATEWVAVKLNDTLVEGDQIETKITGRVEFRLDNGNLIALKPNTTIVLTELSRDPKTGDYKNLLEASLGKLRAKVEKLKGDSKFEIKTPTAVASVRGTTVYLSILPGLTKVFFEEGKGTLTSLISQISKVVGDGQTSSADDQGNVSDSTDATDEEKSGWTGGWDTGEAEGYTPPEGGEGDTDPGDEGDEGDGGDVYIPPDPDDDTPPAEPGTTNLTGTVGGGFIADIGDLGSGVVTGLIEADLTTAALTPIWFGTSESNSSPATIEGIYTNPEGASFWASEVNGAGDDGGVFTGLLVGTWNSWEGALASIYIDSSGIAGTMVGYLEGTSDETEGTMTGSGDIFIMPMTETALLPGDLLVDDNFGYDFLEGVFGTIFDSDSGPGYINGYFDRYLLFIKEEPWGIWASTYAGEYERPLGLSEWSGRARGSRYIDQPNYFVSTVEAADDLNGALRMDVLTTYLDTEFLGAFYGTVLGAYKEGGFEGVGAGGYVMEPLTLSGAWGMEAEEYVLEGSLYYNNGGNISEIPAGEEYGLIGSVTPNWWQETFEITAIGEWYDDVRSGPYIWNTPIRSMNFPEATYTTRDGGAFFGFTHGIWKNEVMDGYAMALYLDPDGNVGYLLGSLSGSYFPLDTEEYYDIWSANGSLTPRFLGSTNIDPINFVVDESIITPGPRINLRVSGSFINGQGHIEGAGQGYAYHINDGEDNLPWGIFNIKFGDSNSYSDRPKTATRWSGVIGGYDEGYDYNYWLAEISNGTWENNELRADISGLHLTDETLRTLGGNIFGIEDGEYNEIEESYTGSWIATSIGTSIRRGLTFTGLWGEEMGASLYYNDDGYIEQGGEEFGLLGSVTPNWWDGEPFRVIAMGGYTETETGPYIWNTPIMSYNGPEVTYTTLDGGAFHGCTAGIWNNGNLDGSAVALYAAPVEIEGEWKYNLGILNGDLEGNYYPGIGMWGAAGYLTAEAIELGVPLTFEELNSPPYIDESFDSNLLISGDFNVADSSIYGDIYSEYIYALYEEASWGIYDFKFGDGNTYYNPDPTTYKTWSGTMSSIEEDDWESFYLLADISGTWEDGEIKGDVSGAYLAIMYDDEESHLGRLEGDFYGINNGYEGTWIGTSIGTWQEEPLVSAGELYNTIEYFDDEEIGYFAGYMGITGSIWGDGNNCDFTSIGDFSLYGEEPFVWHSECDEENIYPAIYSYDPYIDRYTTYGNPFGAFYGITVGIGDNDELEGLALAIYIDPDTNAGTLSGPISGFYSDDIAMYILEGELTNTLMDGNTGIPPEELLDYIDFSDIEGGGFGSFETGGDITVHTVEGVGINIYTKTDSYSDFWGIWGTVMFGSYTGAVSPSWQLDLSGVGCYREDMGNYYFEETVSCWLGRVNGTASSNRLDGSFNGIWIGFHDDKVLSGGTIISSDVIGNYVEGNSGVWQAGCGGEWVTVEEELDLADIDNEIIALGNLVSVPIVEPYSSTMSGSGTFDSTGEIAASMDMSFYATSNLAPEGIWVSVIEDGTYAGPTSSSWQLALGGTSSNENVDVCLLGTIDGDEWSDTDGWLGGEFRGVWFAPIAGSDNIKAGDIYGGVSGEYIDVGDGTGTWQAVGIGDWVEVTDLLTEEMLGFDMEYLNEFVSVPITETHAAYLMGNNDFITFASMNISLYNDLLWTALIYGDYSDNPTDPTSWSLYLSQGDDNVTLQGSDWTNNEWLAGVTGIVDGSAIEGAAGGIYGDGEFEGVGAGTVVAPVVVD